MYVSSRFERLDCANGNPVALEAGQHRVDGASAIINTSVRADSDMRAARCLPSLRHYDFSTRRFCALLLLTRPIRPTSRPKVYGP